jgi:hypothetical protein
MTHSKDFKLNNPRLTKRTLQAKEWSYKTWESNQSNIQILIRRTSSQKRALEPMTMMHPEDIP